MRRLGSTFVTLWLTFFVPSLIVWGLMLRWSDTTADRFESIWRWTADRLAFPLLLERQTEWSWQALTSGSRLDATLGFLMLTGTWAVMLALPLAFIGDWWVWIISRNSRPGVASSPSATFDPQATLALSAPPSTVRSPMGALYLLTIPIALVWASVRWTVRPLTTPHHPILAFLRPILISFVSVFALVVGWYVFAFSNISYVEWQTELFAHFVRDVWYGYLDTLYIPRIFEQRWWEALRQVELTTHTLGSQGWAEHMDGWYRHAEMRMLLIITAARHALGAAIVVTGWQVLRRIF
jgi:hypothetical protein